MKITPFQEWTPVQLSAALIALEKHAERMKDHALVEPESPTYVMTQIRQGAIRAAFIDGYLLVYDIGSTWMSPKEMLFELLLVRALPHASFPAAVAGMRYIASVNGCVGIQTGNGVLRRGIQRMYETQGFRKFNEAYYLEL